MLVNGDYCFTDIENSIARNDGLSFDDFEEWFKDYDLSKPMAIIHYSDFRYSDSPIDNAICSMQKVDYNG